MAFDFTARSYDAEGRLRISRSHISKASVNPYYGREIPNNQALGLDPQRVYYMLRDPEELRKAEASFRILPILSKHTPIDIYWDDDKRKKFIVGSTGSEVEFLAPYLDADVSIWDHDAIAGIETDQVREFSCGYRYVPIMSPGNYAGQNYDGIMTEIQGNHLALVEAGRAGSDVLAADKQIERESMKRTKLGNSLIVALTTAFPTLAADKLEPTLANARRKSFDKKAATTAIIAMDSKLDVKQVEVVMDALADVDDPEPAKEAHDCATCGAKDGKHAKDCKMAGDAEEETEEEREKRERKEAKDKAAKDKAKDAESISKKDLDGAMDALSTSLRKQFAEADQAKREVREVVGDVVTMDSAGEIYGFALDQMKVEHEGITDANALRALFKLAKSRSDAAAVAPVVAMDAAQVTSTLTRFPGLSRIK